MYDNRKYTLIFSISLIFIVFFNVTYVKSNNTKPLESSYNRDMYLLLARIPEENINLYALDYEKLLENGGEYRQILLDINGKQKTFRWNMTGGLAYRPELVLMDLNNDNKKELVVITKRVKNTSESIEEIHVFNTKTFKEYKVENLFKFISKHIETEIKKNTHNIHIDISLGEQNFIREYSLPHWKDVKQEIYFEDYIEYNVNNNKLFGKVKAYVSGIGCVGTLEAQYKFRWNKLVIDKIDFI